ncbi:MAG: transglycosylase SLT domain-containing protein [Proteobacteria bacterium]|nr:transglycosylase SLT domain-containing protein [Pseudomonadota bacterium]MDA1021955.1 transglycosylase SLT domain-containing protein [Pseudomonadota bacterium]
MKAFFRILGFFIVFWLLAESSPASANPTQAFDNAWNLCATETARTEQRMGVPKHLLKAISLAESGRWDAGRRENVAWPWTVTSGGEGRFFDTKAEAVAEVEILMTQGVRNIDVGCMQVNLYYHGHAFENLKEAFDPKANTTYAAAYLKNMFKVAGNWTDAAGYYHSTTPERNGPYKEKVAAFWRGQGGRSVAQVANIYIPVDHARMGRLNKRFRARLDAGREAEDPTLRGAEALAQFRSQQLEKWRDAKSRGLGTQHLVAMRQAEMELKKKREIDRMTKGDPKTRFATKRAQQLRDWRTGVSSHGRQTLGATSIAAGAIQASVR